MPSTDIRLELKAKDIDGSDRLTAGCVCQWVNENYVVPCIYVLERYDICMVQCDAQRWNIMNQACFNPLNPELNPICYLLALLGAHHFLHVSRIRVKLLNFRLLMSYIYGAPILDVSRSHTTTQHSR